MKKKIIAMIVTLACVAAGTIAVIVCCGDKTPEAPSNDAPHTHIWAQAYETSDTHHWHACTVDGCSEKDGYAEHDFSDGDCICGKIHPHVWAQAYETNDTHHWHACTVDGCSEKDGYAEHDFSDGDCVCGIKKSDGTEGLEYTLTSSGYYYVSGIGSAVDTDIVIPSEYCGKKVRGISNKAFSDCTEITSVTIPDGVTNIDDGAFANCSNLVSVSIPESVGYIGNRAFAYCVSLASITIPEKITCIDEASFSSCSSLTSITIPKNVTQIFTGAFGGCTNLKNLVILSTTLFTISDNAFSRCPIETARIPAKASRSVNNKQLKSVVITSGDAIVSGAFYGCINLESISIPITITDIGHNAFAGCGKLQYNEYENGCYIGGAGAPYFALIKVKDTNTTTFTLHDKTSCIAEYALAYCSNLKSVTINSSMLRNIGDNAFYGCLNLTSIIYSGHSAQWRIIKKAVSWNSNTGNYTVSCTDRKLTKSESSYNI